MIYKIILPGVPINSNRGALGWCTVSLLKCKKNCILIDTGSYSDRKLLLSSLEKAGILPEDIEIIFLTHLHFDHCINIEIFKKAKIMLLEQELIYALSGEFKKHDDPFIPLTFIEYQYKKNRFQLVKENEEIEEGVKVIALPGHTPGSAGIIAKDKDDKNIIFTGDALKNAWDLVHKTPPPSFYDPKSSIRNYEIITKLADIIVPGHDRPFIIENRRIKYISNPLRIEMTTYSTPYSLPQKHLLI